MTLSELPAGLTASHTSMAIIARTKDAIFVRLPEFLQRSCDGCSCDYCKAHPDKTPAWDTLVVPIRCDPRKADFTYTVHMPDPQTFKAYMASKKAAKTVTDSDAPTGKATAFTAHDADGKAYRWTFWRDGDYWMLRDYTGYLRTLEHTWIDSVPRIKSILEGHGMTADIS